MHLLLFNASMELIFLDNAGLLMTNIKNFFILILYIYIVFQYGLKQALFGW